jgi:hypothetical protein
VSPEQADLDVPPPGELPDDPEDIKEWIARSRAFHDYHRRKFYEARGRTLAAIELMRRLAERRRQ